MSSELTLVGLVSSYLEGRLVRGAIESLVDAVDRIYVCEGPAGAPLEADVPPTDLGGLVGHPRLVFWEGRWRTDARKRTAMLQRAREEHARSCGAAAGEPTSPLWGIWLDGDEVLFNGRYVRDWLQMLAWREELNPAGDPFLGRPIRIVELDGSVGWTSNSIVRIDLIRSYDVSAATFTNEKGVLQGAGNIPDSYSDWATPRTPYFERDQMLIQPPIPGEPFVLHRSALRHPLRAGLRMHHQEGVEMEKRKTAATRNGGS